jgi:phosphoglycolate phosphatase
MLKLAVFDCDGTLVDSQHAINACMADAFTSLGYPEPDIADVRRVVGLPLVQAIEIIAKSPDAPAQEMAAAYSKSWIDMRSKGNLAEPVFDGIVNVLDSLSANDWFLGVATGKSMRGLKATLEHHQLEFYFQTLQTADKAKGKPDPQMLEFAMAETGAEPSETVMIGDTTYDIEMANAIDVKTIGVSWGYHAPEDLKSAGASFIVHSTGELGTLLNSKEGIFS